jgi:hypothetical protein
MNASSICTVNDAVLVHEIDGAEKRLVFVAPGVTELVAASLVETNAKKLADALAPSVARKRPERWTRFLGPNPKPTEIREQLEAEIRSSFGNVETIVSEMSVNIVYKGVTYETLTNEKFLELAQKSFPHLRLMDEYEAAPQSAKTEKKPK